MKQNLLEEINKMKMMFSYDNKKTLTENINIKEQLGALRDLAKVDREFLNANRAELENILSKSVGGLKDINGNSLKTADELFTAIKTDKLAPAALGKVNRGLLSSTSTSREVKEAVAKDIGEFMYTKKADYAGATRTDMKDALVKQKNYSPEEAEMILKAYEGKGGLFKDSKTANNARDAEAAKDLERQKELDKLKDKNKKNDFERQKELEKLKDRQKQAEFEKEIEKYNVPKEKEGVWKKFKERINKAGFVKSLLFLGGVGLAAYLLYDWFMNDDENVTFPDCLKNKVSKDDWDETIKNGQCLIINVTGNEQIDSIGGGKFYEDGRFKSGDDSQQGTWSDEGGNIVIKVGTDNYTIPCNGETPNPDNDDDMTEEEELLEDSDVTFGPCDSLPLSKGCTGEYVRNIRECLGLKGNHFTSLLERKLLSQGYDIVVTTDIYNRIMKKCGKEGIYDMRFNTYSTNEI
jgi:hypothetical protein